MLIRLGLSSIGLYSKATLSLPTCSWAEKSGVYENFEGRIQPFAQAIPPLEDTRSLGQICWDLLGMGGRYNASTIRHHHLAAAGFPDYGTQSPNRRAR